MSKQLQTIKQLQRELDTPKHKVRFTLDGNGSVNFLDLSNLGMETRHLEMVNNFPDLIVLWAKNNNIDKIKGIDNLTKVRWVDFNYNNISKIENLENLVSIEDLSLGGNKIEKIENLRHLVRLESIALFNNNITRIEGLKGLKRLVYVTLWGNDLVNIDEFEEVVEDHINATVLIFVKPKGRQNPLLSEYSGSISTLI